MKQNKGIIALKSIFIKKNKLHAFFFRSLNQHPEIFK